MRTFKIAPLAAATGLALGLGAAGSANADVYGVSFTEIRNGSVSACVDKTQDGIRNSCTIDATILNFVSIVSSSATNAVLSPGGSASDAASGVNPNALASEVGSAVGDEYVNGTGTYTNASYILIGDDDGNFATNYARGDARVVSEQSQTSLIQAWQVAEVNLVDNISGTATGQRDSSQSQLEVKVNAGNDCATYDCYIYIQFEYNPYIRVEADASTIFDAFVNANANITASLVDPNGDDFFNGGQGFTPLNVSRSRDYNNQGSTAFSSANTYSFFQGASDSLVPNAARYQLTLTATNEVFAKNVERQVPEPGTLALFGLGLFGLSMSAWRKRGARKA